MLVMTQFGSLGAGNRFKLSHSIMLDMSWVNLILCKHTKSSEGLDRTGSFFEIFKNGMTDCEVEEHGLNCGSFDRRLR